MLPLAELPKSHGLPDAATKILDGIDTFAIVCDESLTPVYANTAARRSETISGAALRTPAFLDRARRVLKTGVPSHRDPHPDDPSDTVRTHLLRLEPGLLVILAEDLGEEQRLTAMRRDFIANVSHELKTPIAAIGLLAEAVREATGDPDLVREFATSLIKEARRLANLSQDIIRLSEAQSQLRPESLETVDLRALVAEELDAHREFAAQNDVRVVFVDDTNPKRGALIQGRTTALGTALANILSNAIRHSPAGGTVRVRASHKKRFFQVTVRDEGEGISPEHVERIFERFYRIDSARNRDNGGTGLGLSIARHSMRAHGGDVTVRSEPGAGARFALTFPLKDLPVKKRAKRVKRTKKALDQLTDPKGHA